MLLSSGVRASELLALNIEDIDLVERTSQVHHGKGNKHREVYFDSPTRKALRAYLRHRPNTQKGPLFWSEKEQDRLHYDGLRAIVFTRSQTAGVDKAPSIHSFRRAFTIDRIRAGVDNLTISKLLGHSTTTMVARYAKHKAQELKEAHDRQKDE
jgi:site-specific recombinase XerD